MMRKTVSFALVLIMIVCTFAFTGSVSYADVSYGYCGEGGSPNVMWEFDPWSGTLTISGNGRMRNYSTTDMPDWSINYDEIKKVVVEEGVTGIGSGAFYTCKAEEFVLPDTIQHIEISSFKGTTIEYVDENNAIYAGQYLVDARYDHQYSNGNFCRDYVVRDGTRVILNGAFMGTYTMFGPSEGLTDEINYSLLTVTLPSSIVKVYEYAFTSCWVLQRVYCRFGEGETGDQVKEASKHTGDGSPIVVFNYKEADFKDVPEGKWYTEGVKYCSDMGFMVGVSNAEFAPDKALTRAMFVTVLSKMTREDKSKYTGTGFTDVEEGKWYSKPIEWARRNGLAAGVGNGKFGVNDPLTREQFATFLFAFFKNVDSKYFSMYYYKTNDLSAFRDSGEVSAWAAEGMSFAVGNGVISGTSADTLSPRSPVTRAQAAVMIRKYDLFTIDHQDFY